MKNTWYITKVREYIQLRKRFLELLLVLAHMTIGLLGYREEITLI